VHLATGDCVELSLSSWDYDFWHKFDYTFIILFEIKYFRSMRRSGFLKTPQKCPNALGNVILIFQSPRALLFRKLANR
jgi:hypothetical protein